MQTTKFIWFDGKLVPWDEAQVHVLTHALHYGSAIFEGIRAYACADGSSAVFRLDDHCKRMVNSAKILRMDLPYSAEQLAKACIETLEANKLPEGYIRPLSFVGHGEMGVYPGNNAVQTIIAVWPWGAYLGAEALEKGIQRQNQLLCAQPCEHQYVQSQGFRQLHQLHPGQDRGQGRGLRRSRDARHQRLCLRSHGREYFHCAGRADQNNTLDFHSRRHHAPVRDDRGPRPWATRWKNSSLPATSSTLPTRRSLPARRPS